MFKRLKAIYRESMVHGYGAVGAACVTCDTVITIKYLIECADLIEIRKYYEEKYLDSLFRNDRLEGVFHLPRKTDVFSKIWSVL